MPKCTKNTHKERKGVICAKTDEKRKKITKRDTQESLNLFPSGPGSILLTSKHWVNRLVNIERILLSLLNEAFSFVDVVVVVVGFFLCIHNA